MIKRKNPGKQNRHPPGKGIQKQPTGKGRKKRKKSDGSSERVVINSLKALQLKCGGASYQMISEQLKVARSTAFSYVENALALLIKDDSQDLEKWRRLENERLDMLWMKVFPNVVNVSPDSKGMVAITDDFLKSINLCIRISRRRAKMNGLDIVDRDYGLADDGQSPELKQVINIFNVIRKRNPKALDAALEVFPAPPLNGARKAPPRKKPKTRASKSPPQKKPKTRRQK